MQNNIYFGYDLLPESSLEHFGIPKKSGRYPWGSGENPYHHGADAPGGRKLASRTDTKSFFKRISARRAEVRKAKEEKTRLELEEKERRKKEAHEAAKQEAINSGEPKKIAPYIKELTDSELEKVNKRITMENRFSQLYVDSEKNLKTAADRVQAKLDKLNSYTNTGINTYNNFAKIYNVFSDPDDKLPLIKDGDGGNKSKKKTANAGKQIVNTIVKTVSENQNDSANNKKGSEKVTSKPVVSNEKELVDKWRSETNDIVNRPKSESRKEFRREMAEEYSKHLKEENDAALRERWNEEQEEAIRRAKKRHI